MAVLLTFRVTLSFGDDRGRDLTAIINLQAPDACDPADFEARAIEQAKGALVVSGAQVQARAIFLGSAPIPEVGRKPRRWPAGRTNAHQFAVLAVWDEGQAHHVEALVRTELQARAILGVLPPISGPGVALVPVKATLAGWEELI